MAKSRTKTKQKLFSAGSELRKGYTMPTLKKIKTVLRSRSKTFLVNLEMPKLSELHLTQTPKSIVTCRICRGQRIVAIESNVFHSYTFKKCLLCKGSGVMSTDEGTYERS